MKISNLAFSGCLAVAAILGHAQHESSKNVRDVCVVGGGPGGVYAARLLEEKGYDVVLFEKEGQLGGKTVPAVSDDGQILLRHLLTSGMRRVIEFKDVFRLPSFPVSAGTAMMPSGKLVPIKDFPPPTLEQIEAIRGYVTTLEGELFQIVDDPDHLGVPEALMSDLRTWLQSQGLGALEPMLYLTVTNFGYGLQQEVPAIYILKYYGIDSFLDAVERKYDLFPMHLIVQGLGATLKDVRLGQQVEEISANGEVSKLFIKGGDTVQCHRTVIAFPQVSNSMRIIKNLFPPTKALFEKVKNVFYYEMILKNVSPESIPGPMSYSRFYEPSGDTSLPNIYSRLTPTSDIVALFNSGYMQRNEATLKRIIREHVQLVFNYTLQDSDIEFYKEHTYMPHVLEPEMKAGFYDQLDQIQGHQGLFYVGGLLDFELVDTVLRSTEKIVEKFF